MRETAVIILAHGSPNGQDIVGPMEYVSRRVKSGLIPDIEVEWAALQFNRPNLGEVVESFAKRGIKLLKHLGQ